MFVRYRQTMTMSGITIFCPVAVRSLMAELRPRLESKLDTPLLVEIDLNPSIADRIAAGETFDVGLTNPHYVPELIELGRVDADSHRPFGRVPLAIARRAAEMGPIACDLGGIVALIQDAKSIGYTGAGTSGKVFLEVLERLGLSDQAANKSIAMAAGEPTTAVAAGEIELGVAPLTTVLSAEGVSPAAIFPHELGADIDISVFLPPKATRNAAKALGFLTSSEIDRDLSSRGLMRFSFV
jgi:Bacterial extracellular solute-binding protein